MGGPPRSPPPPPPFAPPFAARPRPSCDTPDQQHMPTVHRENSPNRDADPGMS